MLRRRFRGLALIGALVLAPAVASAESWASFVTMSAIASNTLGRLCTGIPNGVGKYFDIACPSYAPSMTTAGDISVTGNLSAAQFFGDGSELTGVTASGVAWDNIISIPNQVQQVSSSGSMTMASVSASTLNSHYLSSAQGYIGTLTANGAGIGSVNATRVSVTNDLNTLYLSATTAYAGRLDGGVVSATTVNGHYASFTTLTAGSLYGDGSGLTGITADATDRITSGTTRMVVVSDTGYVSLTQAGTNTGWFSPYTGLVTLGVSATGPISGSAGYFYGTVGIGTVPSSAVLDVVGGSGRSRFTASNNGRIIEFNPANGSIDYFHNGGATSGGYFYINRTNNAHHILLNPEGTGRVGIGTLSGTAPNATLEVNGVVSATNLRVANIVTASFYEGDGSRLTGISANQIGGLLGDRIVSGSTNIVANQNTSLTFTTAGSQRMVIDENGYLGIGTNAPLAKLTVSATSSAPETIGIFGAGAGGVSLIANWPSVYFNGYYDGATKSLSAGWFGGIGFDPGTGRYSFSLSSATTADETFSSFVSVLDILPDGHVGIFKSNPKASLDVAGTISASDAIQVGSSSLTCDPSLGGAIRYSTPSIQVCNGGSWVHVATGGSSAEGDRIVSGTTNITAYEDTSLTFTTAGSPRAILDERGYMGLGHVTPDTLLDVRNGAGMGANVAAFRGSDSGASGQAFIHFNNTRALMGYDGVRGVARIGGGTGKGIAFDVDSNTERMRIASTGEVGIGAITPTATLQVSGSLIVSSTLTNTKPSLYVGTDGKVGIGLMDPTSTLAVNANAGNVMDLLRRDGTGQENRYYFRISSAPDLSSNVMSNRALSLNAADYPAEFGVRMDPANSLPQFIVTNAGNVGVNVMSPTATLDVWRRDGLPAEFRLRAYDGGVNQAFHIIVSETSDYVQLDVKGTGGHNTDRIHLGDLDNADNAVTMLGAVGIGTITPTAKLDVNGTISASDAIQVGSSSLGCNPSLGGAIRYSTPSIEVCNGGSWVSVATGGSSAEGDRIVSGTTNILANEDTSLTFTTAGSERMVVGEDGNVGIGTATPSNFAGHLNLTLGAGYSGANLDFVSASTRVAYIVKNQYGMNMGTADALPFAFHTNSSERMRIDSDGNVGIGITAPSVALDVSGTVSATALNLALVSGSYGLGGDTGVSALNDLSDVDTSGAATGSILAYDGANWVVSSTDVSIPDWYSLTNIPTQVQAVSNSGSITMASVSASTLNSHYLSSTQGTIGALTGGTAAVGGFTVTGDSIQKNVSITNLIQLSSTAQSCTTGVSGSIRYSAVSSTMEYCNSTAWVSMGPSSTEPVAFSAIGTGTQSISAGSTSKLTLLSDEKFDTNNNFASNRFTVTVPGKYLLTAQAAIDFSTTGYNDTWLVLYKNGSNFYSGNRLSGESSLGDLPLYPNFTTVVSANAGDYFEVYLYQYSSGATNVLGDRTAFSGALLAPQGGSGGGAGNLDELSDVSTAGAATGSVLAYDGTNWVVSSSAAAATVDGAGSANHIAYWSDADTLTYDSSQLYWDNGNKRLGIGTSSPVGALDISTSTGGFRFNGTGDVFSLMTNGWNYITAPQASGRLVFQTGGTNHRMTIDQNGNVGIGTTAPGFPLDISGSSTGINLRLQRNDNNNEGGEIAFSRASDNAVSWKMDAYGNNVRLFNFSATQTDGDITLHTGTGAAERMRIKAGGNVGIGTSVPDARLHISGANGKTGSVYVGSTTSRTISFGNIGVAAPAAGSDGMKLQLYGNTPGTMTASDYALGIEANNMWFHTSKGFKWYAQGIAQMAMDVSGNVSLTGVLQPGQSSLACSSTISGSIRYGTVSDTLQVCTSGGWVSLVSGTTGLGTTSPASSTGAIQFNAGGSFGGDTDNLYWENANKRLGIGTTAPAATLDVRGLGMVWVSGSTAGYNFVDRSVSDGYTALYRNANKTRIYDNTGGDRLTIDNITGKVGIGITAPTTNLHISSSGAANLKMEGANGNVVHEVNDEYDITYTRTSGDPYMDLRALAGNGTGNSYYRFGLSSGSTGTNNIQLYQPNSTSIQTKFSSAAANSYINSFGGNLGVRTSSPKATLDVAGNVSVSGIIDVGHTSLACSSTISGSIRFEAVSDTLQVCTSGGWKSLVSSSVAAPTVDGTGSANHIAYWSDADTLTYDSNQLYWDATNHRMGIATNTPVAPLDISATGDGSLVMRFGIEREWCFMQRASGSSAYLTLESDCGDGTNYKSFGIVGNTLRFGTSYSAPTFTVTGSSGDVSTNGIVQAGNGSTSAPSYSFGSDTNLGIYRVAGDTLGVTTNGSERVRMSASGISSSVNFFAPDGSAANPGYNFASDTDNGMFRATTNEIAFATGGSEAVRIKANGNTGIGQTNPAAKLDVNGTISASDAVQVGASSLACTSGIAGALRYNSGTLQMCNGTSWKSIGIGIPAGTIAAFSAASCPSGWSEYAAARGKFLRGIDTTGSTTYDPDGTRTAGSYQADNVGSHTHTVTMPTIMSGGSANNPGTNIGGATTVYATNGGSGYTIINPRTTNSNGAGETRPQNVAVLYCEYMGDGGESGFSSGVNFSAPDGSAANPGYTFTSDTNSGLFRIADDTIGFSAGSGERVRVSPGGVSSSVNLYLNNGSPTLYFLDTDHRSAMIHNNSNILYFLRGSGTGSSSWTPYGSYWPLQLNLENNDATFGGNVSAYGYFHLSDRRLKKDIKPVTHGLDIINRLQGVSYRWKLNDRPGMGVVAQEVEKVLPSAVSTNDKGHKNVDYDQLIAPLIEAVKELKAANDNLKLANEKLEADKDAVETRLDALEKAVGRLR